jgi:hypothetical protein
MPTAESVIERIREAIERGKGRFGLASITAAQAALVKPGVRHSLFVGECNMVRLVAGHREGFIVAVGMNRDHILELRAQCDEALRALDEAPHRPPSDG